MEEAFQGAARQRCAVRSSVTAAASPGPARGVPAWLDFSRRSLGPRTPTSRAPYHKVTEPIAGFCPAAAEILEGAEADAPACLDFPPSHWKRLRANIVQERANRELKGRSRAIRVFPGRAAFMRVVGAAMADANERAGGTRATSRRPRCPSSARCSSGEGPNRSRARRKTGSRPPARPPTRLSAPQRLRLRRRRPRIDEARVRVLMLATPPVKD